MGLLLDTRSGRLITLSARTLLGRSPACDVRLDDPRVSAEHAAIAWSGERWEVRDLGSLNGTWLDGRRLGAGERAPVRRDARLAFGGGDAWILADDHPVGPAARSETTSEVVHSTSGILALPSTSDPQATIFRRADGQWLVELGPEICAVADRDALEVGGDHWWLFLPGELGPVPTTQKADGTQLTLAEISLHFAPSLDEEHVDVRARTDDGKELALPPRSSHYLLLTLSRARLEDQRQPGGYLDRFALGPGTAVRPPAPGGGAQLAQRRPTDVDLAGRLPAVLRHEPDGAGIPAVDGITGGAVTSSPGLSAAPVHHSAATLVQPSDSTPLYWCTSA